jgi:oxygen-independent coproporphyrinogen-3 oxidase
MPTLAETVMMKQLAIDLLSANGYHENLRRVYSRERHHFSHYADEQRRWVIVLPLKNRALWKQYFSEVTGGASLDSHFRDKLDRLKAFDLIREDDEKFELTTLGAFVADEVVQQFHAPHTMPFPAEAYADGPLHPLRS